MAGLNRKCTKAPEPVHVVRRWTSSPFIYGRDSRDATDNPAFHPPIGLTSRGTFVDDRNLPLDPKNVPEYIRVAAKTADLNIEFRAPRKQQGTLREAMRQSGVQDPSGLDLNAN